MFGAVVLLSAAAAVRGGTVSALRTRGDCAQSSASSAIARHFARYIEQRLLNWLLDHRQLGFPYSSSFRDDTL